MGAIQNSILAAMGSISGSLGLNKIIKGQQVQTAAQERAAEAQEHQAKYNALTEQQQEGYRAILAQNPEYINKQTGGGVDVFDVLQGQNESDLQATIAQYRQKQYDFKKGIEAIQEQTKQNVAKEKQNKTVEATYDYLKMYGSAASAEDYL